MIRGPKVKKDFITYLAGIFAVSFSLFIQPAYANTIEKKITLIRKDGSKLEVAKIILTPQENKTHSFEIKWDDSKFSEHFLSMRPFKCIDGPQTVCHLGYPYKTKNRISKSDLQDLEYALLFIHKNQKEYGINFWNGVYYRLKKRREMVQ